MRVSKDVDQTHDNNPQSWECPKKHVYQRHIAPGKVEAAVERVKVTNTYEHGHDGNYEQHSMGSGLELLVLFILVHDLADRSIMHS